MGRQRAAILGQPRQLCRIHCVARAGRSRDGPRPPVGRPPHARLLHADAQSERDVHLLRVATLRRQSGDGPGRLRRAARARAPLPAEADYRRCECLPTRVGLRADARGGRRGGRRMSAADRHGAHQRARRRARVRQPLRARRCGDVDDAQEPARPAVRYHLLPEGSRGAGERGGVPGVAGWAAQPPDRRTRRRATRGRHARVPRVHTMREAQRGRARRTRARARPARRDGRHGQPPCAVQREGGVWRDGQQDGAAVRGRRHLAQQECGRGRHERSQPERCAAGHACDDNTRRRRGALSADSRARRRGGCLRAGAAATRGEHQARRL
mmetsp:Transcript_8579/g.27035  ORF Transcript_8579/g.27035 Transcript_8579/m.27035 type:complete len:326 (+) Transcript_8579:346-1323(+)